MIIHRIENGVFTTYYEKQNLFSLPLFDETLKIEKRDNIYKIHLPNQYISNLNSFSSNTNVLVKDPTKSHSSLFCFTDVEKETMTHGRYQPEDIVTIGSSILDKIYVQDDRLYKRKIYIHMNTKEIEMDKGIPCGLNGKWMKLNGSFQDGDVLECYGLRILLHTYFLQVEYSSAVLVHLKPLEQLPMKSKLPKFEWIHLNRNWQEMELSILFKKTIDCPKNILEIEQTPFLLSIGPSFLFAISTLFVGFLSADRIYTNGGEWKDFLPSLILPATMLISCLLWTPLQRYFEKKSNHKKQRKQLDWIRKECENVRIDLENFIQQYEITANQLAPSLQTCYQNIKNGNFMIRRSPKDRNWLAVHCGTKFDCINKEVLFQNAKEYDLLSLSEYTILQDKLMDKEELSWVLLLNQYSTIGIQNTEYQDFLFWNVIFQLVVYCDEKDLGILFYCNEDFLKQKEELVHIPHLYFENHIGICNSYANFMDFYHLYENSQKSFIIFSTYPIQKEKFKNHLLTFHLIQDETEMTSAYDLLLECDYCFGRGIDYKKNKEFIFHPDWNEWDVKKIRNLLTRFPCLYHTDMSLSFCQLHNINSVDLLPIDQNYISNHVRDGMKVRIGQDKRGNPITLDLHEKGDGPHGIVAGCTGSGKSEFLISLLLALAIQFSPQELQFILIDFKGGGLITSFLQEGEQLPHINCTLTNLDDSEMERALVSFRLETKKREGLFQSLSKLCHVVIKDIDSYQSSWKPSYGLPYLSHLVILVDEAAELKSEQPQFLKELISLSRVGRSLGFHLILSTQKPSGIISDQIWSNCRYKVCLKVTEKQDSYDVLHNPDALFLKGPGDFLLLTDQKQIQGHSAYSSATIQTEKPNVSLLDAYYRPILCKEDKTRNKKEISSILSTIRSHYKGYEIENIWQKPLSRIKRNSSEFYSFVAIKDNIYQNRYEYLSGLKVEQPIHAIFTSNREEMRQMMYSYLFVTMFDVKEEDEIYLFDDSNLFSKEFLKYKNLIDILSFDEKEKLENLKSHLFHSNRGCTYIFINDTGLFLNRDYEWKEEWISIFRQAQELNICFLLGFCIANDCPSKLDPYIQRKIALSNDSLQDLSSIFGKTIRQPVKKPFSGILYEEDCLEIQIIETTLQDFERFKKGKKGYRIPYIQEPVSFQWYKGKDFPLGISKTSYDWITLKKEEELYVLSMYKDEWQDFYKAIQDHPAFSKYRNHIHFLLLQEYTKQSSLLEENPILYIGTSFAKQYIFSSSIHHLKKGQAFYQKGGHCEVIHYVKKETDFSISIDTDSSS